MFNVPRASRIHRVRGFSLVELLVGVVIGMIAITVVTQTMLSSEAGKRLEASGNDAQTTGAIAMSTLLRDVRQAGQGFSNSKLLGCRLTLWNGVILNPLGPVTINPAGIPAGDANTDVLLVAYGDSDGSPDGDSVISQTSQNVYGVATPDSFATGNQVVAWPSNTPSLPSCNLTAETATVNAASSQVTVATGVANMQYGTLFNLGSAPTVAVYAVRGGSLTVCDYTTQNCASAGNTGDPTVWVPIATNIVSLRAQYGRDTNAGTMNGIVDTYDQSTPATMCGWYRTSAVRFALVSRSAQYDKDATYTFNAASLNWVGAATAPVDVSALANYERYHFKLFQTTVPLRNIAWQGAAAGVNAGC